MRFLVVLFLAFSLAPAAMAQEKTDHPLLSSYEGSTLKKQDIKDYDEYQLIIGSDLKELQGQMLEGKVTKTFYGNPADRSILEIYKNYKMALEGAGAEILFECNQTKYECVEAYAGPAFGKFSGITTIRNNNGRFLSAKIEQEGQTAYVAVAVSDIFTEIHVIEVKEMETDKVTVYAAALGEGIDKDGYVIVEGIYFDTDKTTLKPESKPALAEVAKLLGDRADLNVYVVGHTDMQGSLSHNMTLSEGRAKAVVTALSGEYSIAADRLEGHGIGPLSPQASNSGDAGRAKNRRVVLVAR